MIAFHRFLIGSAIAFFAVFALWSLAAYREGGSILLLILGVLSLLVAGALGYYLKNLKRFLRL
jgi:hypothetical protein